MTGNTQDVKSSGEPGFEGHVESRYDGEMFEKVSLPDGRTIRAGDVVAYYDNPLTQDDVERGITGRAFYGTVSGIVRQPNGDAELLATCVIGRLSVSDVEVSGEGSDIDPETGLATFVGHYKQSDTQAIKCEWGGDSDDFMTKD